MDALDVLCVQLTRDLFAVAKFLAEIWFGDTDVRTVFLYSDK